MKINEFIATEIARLQSNENVYIPDHLDEIADKVKAEFNTECTVRYVGGFDSPGYDVNYYAFAYIENGTVGIYAYQHEIY